MFLLSMFNLFHDFSVQSHPKHFLTFSPCLQIDKEREGYLVDYALLKSVLGIFVEIGMGKMEVYQGDFEHFFLLETEIFYKKKAMRWIGEDSCPEYLVKVARFGTLRYAVEKNVS